MLVGRSVFLMAIAGSYAVSVAAQSSDSMNRPLYGVRGVVTDETRVPIPDVEVSIEANAGSVRVIRTATDGMFQFGDVPRGKLTWRVKRIGYAPATGVIEIPFVNSHSSIIIRLKAAPNTLADVIVLGQDSRLRQFYDRRSLHASGTFLTHAEIERLNPRFSSDIFRRIPGASIRSARFGNTIRLRGCRPRVWMDGVPMRDVELDELTNPVEIAGLEVYASTAGLPAEYMDVAPRPCGVILVWTRVD